MNSIGLMVRKLLPYSYLFLASVASYLGLIYSIRVAKSIRSSIVTVVPLTAVFLRVFLVLTGRIDTSAVVSSRSLYSSASLLTSESRFSKSPDIYFAVDRGRGTVSLLTVE